MNTSCCLQIYSTCSHFWLLSFSQTPNPNLLGNPFLSLKHSENLSTLHHPVITTLRWGYTGLTQKPGGSRNSRASVDKGETRRRTLEVRSGHLLQPRGHRHLRRGPGWIQWGSGVQLSQDWLNTSWTEYNQILTTSWILGGFCLT